MASSPSSLTRSLIVILAVLVLIIVLFVLFPNYVIIAALAVLLLFLNSGESTSTGRYNIPDLDDSKVETIQNEINNDPELRGVEIDTERKEIWIRYPTRNPGAIEKIKGLLQEKGISLEPK